MSVYNKLIMDNENIMVFDPEQYGDPILVKEFKDGLLSAVIRIYDDGRESILKVIEGGLNDDNLLNV